jgi:hypothetical protein
MKKAIIMIVMLLFMILISFPSYGGATKLVIDGKRVQLDTDPIIRSASVFVPLRGVFEVFKAQVTYDKPSQTVRAVRGNNKVVIIIDSNKAKVNGLTQIMPTPAFIYNNRTMVPLRFISESLGCEVRWEPATSTIYIDSKPGSGKEPKDPDVDDIDVKF